MDIIGQGSYGTVRVDKYNCNAVVKTVKYASASTLEQTGLLSNLSEKHLFIATVHCIAINGPYITIKMKRYEGDVHQYMLREHSKLTLLQTLQMERQIGSAITFLHENDILHGDVKPENILHDDALNFYLTDFSLAMNLKTEKLDHAEQLYSIMFRPPILNYNDQIRDGFSLKEEYDYYALFMTLCFVNQGFLISRHECSLYDVILSGCQFREMRFPSLMVNIFENVIYTDKYYTAFDVCF